MPSERLLRASELPPGSRMFPRQGSALTGQEIGEAIVRVVGRMLEAEEVEPIEINAVINELDEQMARGWWRAPHLTFPRAILWFEIAAGEGETWCDIQVDLGVIGSATSKVHLKTGVGMMRVEPKSLQLGPSRIPDQMREELGLPLTAHFRLPDGSVVLAELADPTAEEVGETRGWFKGPNYHIPIPRPEQTEPSSEFSFDPANLVATPPPAPPVPLPVEKPVAKTAPKLVAGKGGRR